MIGESTYAWVTIILPKELLELADRLAREGSISRSGIIAGLLEREEQEWTHLLMADGYKAMSKDSRATLHFDRRLRLEFRSATITSDTGLLACRELDDALGLTETATACLLESRGGRNVQHQLVPLLRQSVYSRLVGYEDTNPSQEGLNGWPRTRLCALSLDGEAPKDKQQAPTP